MFWTIELRSLEKKHQEFSATMFAQSTRLNKGTEDRIAHLAAAKYQPSREFRALEDFTTFKAVAEQVRAGIDRELSTLNLQTYKRVAFYPFGAGEGLLLDRAQPKWRTRYFVKKFDNEIYFKR